MKRFLITLGILLGINFLYGSHLALAQDTSSDPCPTDVESLNPDKLPFHDKNYDKIMIDNQFINNIVPCSYDTQKGLTKDAWSGILTIVNRILGAVAIIWLVVVAGKLMVSQGNEENMSKYKQQFGWIILGLVVMSMAEFIGFDILNPAENDILSESGGNAFWEKAQQITLFFQLLIGGIMLISLAISGYKLISGGDEDEVIDNEKQFIKSFIFGFFLILLSEVIVEIFRQQDRTAIDSEALIDQGLTQVVGIINFVLTFIGVAALFMLILASLYYIISFGNEDQMNRAKQTIMGSLLGVIIAVSSYAIVTFFVSA
jgi:cbb3-type cytochrome oxidase subunit 3